jgi:hypothetical protein
MGAYIYYTGDFSVLSQWFLDYAMEFKDRAVEEMKQDVTNNIMGAIMPMQAPFAFVLLTFADPNQPTLDSLGASAMGVLNAYGVEAFGDPLRLKYPVLDEARGSKPSFQDAVITPYLR